MNFGDAHRRYKILPYGPACLSALQVVHKTQTVFMMHGPPFDAVAWESSIQAMDKISQCYQEQAVCVQALNTDRATRLKRPRARYLRRPFVAEAGQEHKTAVPNNLGIQSFTKHTRPQPK